MKRLNIFLMFSLGFIFAPACKSKSPILSLTDSPKESKGTWVAEATEYYSFYLNSEIVGDKLVIKEDNLGELYNTKGSTNEKIHELCKRKVSKGTYAVVAVDSNYKQFKLESEDPPENILTKVKISNFEFPPTGLVDYVIVQNYQEIGVPGKRLSIDVTVGLGGKGKELDGNYVLVYCSVEKFQ